MSGNNRGNKKWYFIIAMALTSVNFGLVFPYFFSGIPVKVQRNGFAKVSLK